MGVPNGIDYLYSAVEGAVEFCNSQDKKQVMFDPKKTRSNFAQDLMSLAAYSICADGKITSEEVVRLNRTLGMFDFELSTDDCRELQKVVSENPFEIPKTLRVLVIKAEQVIESWRDMGYKMVKLVTMKEISQLTRAL